MQGRGAQRTSQGGSHGHGAGSCSAQRISQRRATRSAGYPGREHLGSGSATGESGRSVVAFAASSRPAEPAGAAEPAKAAGPAPRYAVVVKKDVAAGPWGKVVRFL